MLTFLVVAAVVVWLAVKLVQCLLWPFASCRRCGGSGRRRSPAGKNYGRCRRCKGGGERLRFGRKVMNRLGIAKDKMVG